MNTRERNRLTYTQNREKILAALCTTGRVSYIAKLSGLSRPTIYEHLHRMQGRVIHEGTRWRLNLLYPMRDETQNMLSEALAHVSGELKISIQSMNTPGQVVWIEERGPYTELRSLTFVSGKSVLDFFDTTSGRPREDLQGWEGWSARIHGFHAWNPDIRTPYGRTSFL